MTKGIWTMRTMVTGGAVCLTSALGTVGVAAAATPHRANTTHLTIKSFVSPHDGPGDPTTLSIKPGEITLSGAATGSADAAAATAVVPGATVTRVESGPNATYVVLMKARRAAS